MNTPLQQSAQAMIDRWDSTDWKDTPHTAHYVDELRKALDAELQQSVEPEVLMVDAAMVEMKNIVPPLRRSECLRLIRAAINATARPPQPHAEPEQSGERAELIADLRELIDLHAWAHVVVSKAADMLEADAQQAKSKDAELIAIHAKLAEAELRANQLESQFKSQCRITASALDERAQQAKRVPQDESEDLYELALKADNWGQP